MAGRRIGTHSGPCWACACDALTQIEPPPLWAGAVVRCTLLRQVVQTRAAHDADGWPSLHHEGRFTDTPHSLAMKIPRHALTRLPSGAGSVPASHSGSDLASIRAHAGAACLRGCRVDHRSIQASSTPASLACRESWRGHGCASGFMAATVRPKQFPRRCAPSSRSKFFGPPGPPRCCGLIALLCGAASPSPAGRITDKDAMGAILQPRKEIHHG